MEYSINQTENSQSNTNYIIEDTYEKISEFDSSTSNFSMIVSKIHDYNQKSNEKLMKMKDESNKKLNKIRLLLYNKYLNILFTILNNSKRRFYSYFMSNIVNNRLANKKNISNLVKKGYILRENSQSNNKNLFIESLLKREERLEKKKKLNVKANEKVREIKEYEKKLINKSTKQVKEEKEILLYKKLKEKEKEKEVQVNKRKEEEDELKKKSKCIYDYFQKRRIINLLKRVKTENEIMVNHIKRINEIYNKSKFMVYLLRIRVISNEKKNKYINSMLLITDISLKRKTFLKIKSYFMRNNKEMLSKYNKTLKNVYNKYLQLRLFSYLTVNRIKNVNKEKEGMIVFYNKSLLFSFNKFVLLVNKRREVKKLRIEKEKYKKYLFDIANDMLKEL